MLRTLLSEQRDLARGVVRILLDELETESEPT